MTSSVCNRTLIDKQICARDYIALCLDQARARLLANPQLALRKGTRAISRNAADESHCRKQQGLVPSRADPRRIAARPQARTKCVPAAADGPPSSLGGASAARIAPTPRIRRPRKAPGAQSTSRSFGSRKEPRRILFLPAARIGPQGPGRKARAAGGCD